MIERIDPSDLRIRLAGEQELALLDVREEGVFSQGHLLHAVPLPLSRLELRIADLVPRRGTAIVVCGDDRLSRRAAERLSALGYGEAYILEGGPEEWRSAGFEIFSGVHVPSKAFGEFVEVTYQTPHISAQALVARMSRGEKVVILDSRPIEEYRTRHIPSAVDVPGVELVYRIHELVESPDTLVVVNCGGRTRSIIGAQSLINAGAPGRILALKDGTMGWHLAGYELEVGEQRLPPALSTAGLNHAKAAASRIARRFGVKSIEHSTLAHWREEQDGRTLYLLDVRQPGEFEAGHLPGAISAQGGQLVQETDRYIGTRGARIVLADDNEVRATVAASWLLQMGQKDVYVLRNALDGHKLEYGARRSTVLGLIGLSGEEIDAHELFQATDGRDEAVTVIDLAVSTNYRGGHIPGAYFAVRSRLENTLRKLPARPRIVVTSEDGILAGLAAPEIAALSNVPVSVLAGGTDAWRAAGYRLATGGNLWADEPDDVWQKPFDQSKGRVEDRLNAYLNWETNLINQIKRDGTTRFLYVAPTG